LAEARKSQRRDAARSARETKPARSAPSFELNARWAAVILAVLVIAFFHEVAIGGRTFVSPDAMAPAGFVRVGEQSLWHDHVYPLWNPYVFLGMPSFGSGAYNPLIYPPDWPLALIQKVLPLPEMTWLLLYYFLGAWFFYLLAREWGARAEGALLGAAAFVFAPNLVAVGSHGHGSQLVDSAYLPLMLWLAARWLRTGRWLELGVLAIAGGFQMLRGHVQICFYTWMAIGLYAVVNAIAAARDPERRVPALTRGAALAGAAALAFGIAGFYNLPLRDYAAWSRRGGGAGGGVGMEYATQWSMAPFELPTIAIPAWVGFGGATYWGGMPFTDYPNAYVGIITVVIALPALFVGGAPRAFALALAALSLLVAFGSHSPFYGFLYDHLPLFNKFRVPVMVILLFQLAAALACGWGWSAILEGAGGVAARRRPVPRLLFGAAAVLALMLVIGVLARDSWRDAYLHAALAARPELGESAAAAAFSALVADLGRAALLGLAAAALAWLAFTRRIGARPASALALVLLLIELWPVSGRVMSPVIGDVSAHNPDLGRDDVVDFLQQAGPPGSFRIWPVNEFQDNRYAGFGIASIGGYHAAKPRLFQDFLDSNLVNNLGWLRLLNVKYIVFSEAPQTPPRFLKLVHQGPGGSVFENLLALPRITLVDRYRVVQPAQAILDSVRDGSSDPAEAVFLERDPGVKLEPLTGGTAKLTSYRLNDVTVDVDVPGPALLRLADLWYPDWTVLVDDKPATLLKADYMLRAVAVPAGHHIVRFEYRSAAVRQGLMLSLVSFAVALGLVLAGWFASRPVRSAPPAPAGVA
jgi:hypothetical protein